MLLLHEGFRGTPGVPVREAGPVVGPSEVGVGGLLLGQRGGFAFWLEVDEKMLIAFLFFGAAGICESGNVLVGRINEPMAVEKCRWGCILVWF